MRASIDPIITELRNTISDLGRDGGKISPSIYDTAQRLRLAPPKAGVEAGVTWLIAQQHEDGGWCDNAVPASRDIPTLAAILAIHSYRQDAAAKRAIQRGLMYLAGHAWRWSDIHINEVPLGAEMILPHLLNEAEQAGFTIDHAPYARLFGMREQKLERLTRYSFTANSAPTYSWEALEQPFAPEMLDPWTGVGHSPAATAAWLQSAGDAPEHAELRALAEAYLARAEAATMTGVPGVVPVVYPITGFELSYGLYALLIAGLLHNAELQSVIQPKLAELHAAVIKQEGLSFGETFIPDVDSTSVAVAVLHAAGIDVGADLVNKFWRDDHYYTYVHELNSSVFSNAHALHALAICGTRCPLTEAYLVERQEPEGHWVADKWHTSWRFATLETINALENLGYAPQLGGAARVLSMHQLVDGSWHDHPDTGILETSYTVLALHKLYQRQLFDQAGRVRLARAHRWLRDTALQHDGRYEERWLGKVVYSPYRVDRVYHLSAALCEPLSDATQPVATNMTSKMPVARTP